MKTTVQWSHTVKIILLLRSIKRTDNVFIAKLKIVSTVKTGCFSPRSFAAFWQKSTAVVASINPSLCIVMVQLNHVRP